MLEPVQAWADKSKRNLRSQDDIVVHSNALSDLHHTEAGVDIFSNEISGEKSLHDLDEDLAVDEATRTMREADTTGVGFGELRRPDVRYSQSFQETRKSVLSPSAFVAVKGNATARVV